MSLAHAILGFLRRGSQTGYTLKNEHFDKSVAYFWPGDQTQIYKTLDKLVEQGFATSEVEIQLDRPNRKVYSITKSGKLELEKWLSEPVEPPVYRDPLLVQIFFSDFVDSDAILEVLASAREKHANILSQLQAIKIPKASKCSDRQELAGRLTLELGLKSKQAYIDWIDQASDAIKSLDRRIERSGR